MYVYICIYIAMSIYRTALSTYIWCIYVLTFCFVQYD